MLIGFVVLAFVPEISMREIILKSKSNIIIIIIVIISYGVYFIRKMFLLGIKLHEKYSLEKKGGLDNYQCPLNFFQNIIFMDWEA